MYVIIINLQSSYSLIVKTALLARVSPLGSRVITLHVTIVPWVSAVIGSRKVKVNSLLFICEVENEIVFDVLIHLIDTTVRLLKQVTLAVDPISYIFLLPVRPIADI